MFTEIDFFNTNNVKEMVDFSAIQGYQEYPVEIHFYRYFVYNIMGEEGSEEENPIADLRVRQALVHALDREELLRSVYFNAGIPIYAGTLSEPTSQAYAYDPQRAKELLIEAEYDFSRPITIMYYYQDNISKIFLDKVAKYLEAIGLKVELVLGNGNEQLYETRRYDLLLKGLSSFDSTEWYNEYLSTNKNLVQVLGMDNPFYELVEKLGNIPIIEEDKISNVKQELIQLEKDNLYKMTLFTLNQSTYINGNRISLPQDLAFGNAWHRYNKRIDEWEVKKE